MFGRSSVRSRPTSTRGASRRVSGGHASIMRRTSSTWLGCGSFPKPEPRGEEPEVLALPQDLRIGNVVERPFEARLRLRRTRTERRLRERRQQHDAAHTFARRAPGSGSRSSAPRRHPSSDRRGPRRADRAPSSTLRTSSAEVLERVTGLTEHRLAVPAVVERDRAEAFLRQQLELVEPGADRQRDAVRQHDRRTLAGLDDVDRATVVRRRAGGRRRSACRATARGVGVGRRAGLRARPRRCLRRPTTAPRHGRDAAAARAASRPTRASAFIRCIAAARADRCRTRSRTGSCRRSSAHSYAVIASSPCAPEQHDLVADLDRYVADVEHQLVHRDRSRDRAAHARGRARAPTACRAGAARRRRSRWARSRCGPRCGSRSATRTTRAPPAPSP